MPKVTSKLQVTIPKALADQAHIQVGDELDCELVANVLIFRPRRHGPLPTAAERLALFDATTAEFDRKAAMWTGPPPTDRGWTREDCYRRDDDDDDLGV